MPTSTRTRARTTATRATATNARGRSAIGPKPGKGLVLPKKRIQRVASILDKEEYADNYIKRELDGEGYTDFIVFDHAKDQHYNVLIEGPTGNGKTSAVMAWSADRGHHFYSISSSIGLEPSQLFGKYIPEEAANGGGIVWVDGPVTDIVRYGGVLLINEINFIPERVGTVLFSLLDKRREIQLLDHRAEVIKAHEDLVIFADMNPDYEGTRQLNKALRNRFAIQLVWDYSPEVESQLIKSPSLLRLAKNLRDQLGGNIETPVSTNMLFELEKNVKYLGVNLAKELFVNHFSTDDRPTVGQVIDAQWGEIAADFKKIKKYTPYGDLAVDPDTGEVYGENWLYDDSLKQGEVVRPVDEGEDATVDEEEFDPEVAVNDDDDDGFVTQEEDPDDA